MAELFDDDLMLVNRAGKSYKVTGAEMKDSFDTGPAFTIAKPTILEPVNEADDVNGSELVFTSDAPSDDPAGSVVTWNNAIWEVSTDSSFGTYMSGQKAITDASAQQTLEPEERGEIELEEEETYYVRVKYLSMDPAAASPYSDVVSFTTSAETFIDNRTDPGYAYNAGTTVDSGALHRIKAGSSDKKAD